MGEDGNIVAIEGFGRKDVQGKNYILPLKLKNDKTDIVLTKLGIYNVSEQEKALVDLNTNSGKLRSISRLRQSGRERKRL